MKPSGVMHPVEKSQKSRITGDDLIVGSICLSFKNAYLLVRGFFPTNWDFFIIYVINVMGKAKGGPLCCK
jgi:hypothetical protein